MDLHFKTKQIHTAAHGTNAVAIKAINFYLSRHSEKSLVLLTTSDTLSKTSEGESREHKTEELRSTTASGPAPYFGGSSTDIKLLDSNTCIILC